MVFKKLTFVLIQVSIVIYAIDLHSLPIGFGQNQLSIPFRQIENNDYRVYFDYRTPHEGAMILNSYEGADKILEYWFKTKRSKILPVIVSATTSNASFANFITDVIELQTLGRGDRDFYWHELVHVMTYLHTDSFFGPPGAVIHLPWVPAWFLEGLPEALTQSPGSDLQSSIERFHALTNTWPTFDRIHSLQGSYNSAFHTRGYAASGSFVSWILKKGLEEHHDFLPLLLQTLFKYTQPQFYYKSFNPFNRFLPMDQAFIDLLGANSKDLYEQYKKEAEAYWKKNRLGRFLYETPGDRLLLTHVNEVKTDGHNAYMIFNDKRTWQKEKLIFHNQSGWFHKSEFSSLIFPEKIASLVHHNRAGLNLFVTEDIEPKSGFGDEWIEQFSVQNGQMVSQHLRIPAKGHIRNIKESPSKIIWLEEDKEITRLCFVNKENFQQDHILRSQISCPVIKRQPIRMILLGDEQKEYAALNVFPRSEENVNLSTKVWLAAEEQTLIGNRYNLFTWDTEDESIKSFPYNLGGQPIDFTETGNKKWLLVKGNKRRFLKEIDSLGSCLGEIPLEDFPVSIKGIQDGGIIVTLRENQNYSLIKIHPDALITNACKQTADHNSPMLWALNHPTIHHLKDAIDGTYAWQNTETGTELALIQNRISKEKPLDQGSYFTKGDFRTSEHIEEAKWKPRPILALPWIGADDIYSNQLGVVSVPLMDEMQNETLRATFLVGIESKYPNTDITFESTRFWPTISAGVFRRQIWDGICIDRRTNRKYTSYLDQKGVSSRISFPWHYWRSNFVLYGGMKNSFVEPYWGPCRMKRGHLHEVHVGAGYSRRIDRVSLFGSAQVRGAPAFMNPNYDYNVLSANVDSTIRLPFWSSFMKLGIEGSRTRGKYTRNLQEVYQPLKTFVPGSGGSYNQNSFPLYGYGTLFRIRYGDTKLRFKSSWSAPLIEKIDKFLWIFYLQSLNLTAFYNYGGAWFKDSETFSSRALFAQGYKLDLLFENKGVSFNSSLGSGQVKGENVQIYATIGFDAFF